MQQISLHNIRQAEGLTDALQPLRQALEERVGISTELKTAKPISISTNLLLRIALSAGLYQSEPRNMEEIEKVVISKAGIRVHETSFSRFNLQSLFGALLQYRYADHHIDWENATLKSRILNYEMQKGISFLLKEDHLADWLLTTGAMHGANAMGEIPMLDLNIGVYEDNLEARLNLNARDIPNTQILIAGSSGSGKSNLLAVLLNEIRIRTFETSYPVNFLLFDYKGEFADPDNRSWLPLFEVNESCILDPIKQPLPFSPFKNFEGRTQNEINLYATTLSDALCAIDNAKISANMSNRLTEAVILAYQESKNRPITFELLLDSYQSLQSKKDQEKDDSVKSVLKQLIRNNLFQEHDSVELIKESFIIKMDGFPKDGPIAKAIVFFIISKINNIYETLPKQAVSDECVEIRHFTIIDEAHYMLDFDNKPLRDLIATGRNKGLSIILATQNMDSYRSKHFDFYANAQYPLIMKQQTITDSVIKDLFGVNGNEFYEVKEAIANLKLGELIIKNPMAVALNLGKKFKKIKTNHVT